MSRLIWNASRSYRTTLGLITMCLAVTVPCTVFGQGAIYPPGAPVPNYSGPQVGYGPQMGYGPARTPYSGYHGPTAPVSRNVQLFGDDGIFTNSEPLFHAPKAETPFERFLLGVTKNSFVRIEYLNWTLDGPGNTLLGSKTATTGNPRMPFPTATGVARVSDLAKISFRDTNGVRGVFGIPLMGATLEISAFLLEQASDQIQPTGAAPAPGNFIGTTVLSNGAVGTNVRVFDQFFKASFTNDFWGGGADVVFDNGPMGAGWRILPIVGFRYLNLSEQLTQLGSFNNGGLSPAFSTFIDSDTINNIYGPTLGFRTEFVHKWFTVGVDNRITGGINNFRTRLTTERILTASEPRMVDEIESTEFSPVWELGVYGKVHINQNFSVFVSYNLLWLTHVARPDEAIRYNVNTVLGTPVSNAFAARKVFESMQIQGVTVGGEIRFR